ncbi:MAG: cell division topological specificity factor MinE [Candidatus Sericytochromatia bacterium]|nr:cell division topological specificity factor MinE [Candidatus Sericytochromatia bacterium]
MPVLASFIDRIFNRQSPSRSTAKDRLRLVLLHDRTDIPSLMLEQMRQDMIAVLSKYVEIDQDALEVNLEKEDGSVALIANIPIRKVREKRVDDAVVQAEAPAAADLST